MRTLPVLFEMRSHRSFLIQWLRLASEKVGVGVSGSSATVCETGVGRYLKLISSEGTDGE